jgi:hypothetical protein
MPNGEKKRGKRTLPTTKLKMKKKRCATKNIMAIFWGIQSVLWYLFKYMCCNFGKKYKYSVKWYNFVYDFRKQLFTAASQGSIEGRIKANINNIQRSGREMNKHFARRWWCTLHFQILLFYNITSIRPIFYKECEIYLMSSVNKLHSLWHVLVM